MAESKYFLDSYALIEILKKNKNYSRFKETLNFTSLMNLLELHYMVSRDFGAKKADEIVERLKELVLGIDLNDIREASRFRVKNSKKKLSYVDCLGYSMALQRNLKFLTGDKEFERMENVEFVK